MNYFSFHQSTRPSLYTISANLIFPIPRISNVQRLVWPQCIRAMKIMKKCYASFNITVPTSYVPERETLDMTRLQIVLQKGFEVKLMIEGTCQECKSTGGVCGYDVGIPVCCKRNSSSKIKCNQMLPSGMFLNY